jgi:transcriptional regulator with GAF, ATPase, and Fis domain
MNTEIKELFREVTVRVCGTLNLKRAVDRTFAYLRNIVPLDELRINILDRDNQVIKVVAVVNENGSKEMLKDPQILPISTEVKRELSGTDLPDVRTVGRLRDDRATWEVRSYFPQAPESSLLIMRLILDGKRQGALILRARGENRYTADHTELISSLNEPFAIALNNALTHHELEKLKDSLDEDNRYLRSELAHTTAREIIGAEFGLSGVMELVSRVAPLESPVVLLGETGVGKELIANALHSASARRDKPLIKVNCAAIPATLIESELFGHEKGAFTGAITQKRGRFERAHTGTLFLDEIGELSPDAQVKLLRVLQSKEFERVGGTTTVKVDVRIIAATHRNLENMVREGTFREDLWYRINVFPIIIPPLRQRKADIPSLAHHFIEKKAREIGLYPTPPLAGGALQQLIAYRWPGNVRELENVVERALILSRGGVLSFDLGTVEFPTNRSTGSLPEKKLVTLDQAVAQHIRRALRQTKGKVAGSGGAAALLAINPSTLRAKMRKLGIPYGRKSGTI